MSEKTKQAYLEHGQAIAKNNAKFRPPMNLVGKDDATMVPSQFPGRFTPWSQEEDTYYERKRMLAAAHHTNGGYGEIRAGDAEIDMLARKETLQRYLEDLKAFSQAYDLNDPAQVAIARKINPRYFEILSEQIDNDAALQAKIAKIKLNGVNSWEDFVFLLQIKRKEIKPSKFALWMPEQDDSNDNDRFRRGMFNPRKYRPLKTAKANDPDDEYKWINNILPGVNWKRDNSDPYNPRLRGAEFEGSKKANIDNYICPPEAKPCTINGGPLP